MKKIIIVSITILALLLTFITPVIAADNNTQGQAKASDKGPKISSDIERVDFIHYAKPAKVAGGKTDPGYKLMGVKWPAGTPVKYVINPTNSDGISEDNVKSAISKAAETWDSETSVGLFADVYGISSAAEYGVFDTKNSIVFGLYSGNNNVIAITSVWYNRKTKEIVEFDMLFNTYYNWGNVDTKSGVMDLQNIATHELGHSVGLNDVYSTSHTGVTMYGYSNVGETIKRSLERPDIDGLQMMYGQ